MKPLNNFYKNKNVLVTGGAGFIGSYIVEELVKNEANVTILDNLSTGNLNNLKSVISQIKIIYGDITNKFTTFNATKNQDIVFHLAAFVSVPESIKNPNLCKKINIEGTENLLISCVKNNVKTLVYSSSASIYGNKNEICNEEDEPNPRSTYAQTKLDGEVLCKKYSTKHNLKTIILRYFNVYGERQNPNGQYAAVVAKFKDNMLKNMPLIIYGSGKQTRDFIHASKVAEANLLVASSENLNNNVFNVATGKSINLIELIKVLEKETNIKNPEIIFEQERDGDILNSYANCDRFYKLVSSF